MYNPDNDLMGRRQGQRPATVLLASLLTSSRLLSSAFSPLFSSHPSSSRVGGGSIANDGSNELQSELFFLHNKLIHRRRKIIMSSSSSSSSSSTINKPYGSWGSSITSKAITAGSVKLGPLYHFRGGHGRAEGMYCVVITLLLLRRQMMIIIMMTRLLVIAVLAT